MNRKIAAAWIALLISGYIVTDYVQDFFILLCLWSGILILGCTIMLKYGWEQSKKLTLYWVITLFLGFVLSAIQFQESWSFLHINHINTIWLILIGANFMVTSFFQKIYYYALTGAAMIFLSLPLDTVNFSFPATTYGFLISVSLCGYLVLSYLTPHDRLNLGKEYEEANGFDEEKFTQMHIFKCSNCGYIYEGHEKINYCPRCMAGADMLEDVG